MKSKIINKIFKKQIKEPLFSNYLNKNSRGFTLVEVLVAVGIFLMIIIVISQIFVAVLHSEQVAYALLNSENYIRDNLELMARSIRMGKDFELLDKDEKGNAKGISFDYYSGYEWERIIYRFKENNLEKNNLPLFDPSVIEIENIRFNLKGTGTNQQKIVIINLETVTKVKKTDYKFYIQTAITPRALPKVNP